MAIEPVAAQYAAARRTRRSCKPWCGRARDSSARSPIQSGRIRSDGLFTASLRRAAIRCSSSRKRRSICCSPRNSPYDRSRPQARARIRAAQGKIADAIKLRRSEQAEPGWKGTFAISSGLRARIRSCQRRRMKKALDDAALDILFREADPTIAGPPSPYRTKPCTGCTNY